MVFTLCQAIFIIPYLIIRSVYCDPIMAQFKIICLIKVISYVCFL